MPDINSPLGRRAFAMANQRTLTIPNEENQITSSFGPPPKEVPQQTVERDFEYIKEARKSRVMAAKKITAVAKERVEILIGLGRCQDVAEFEGVNFSLQSLKAKEIRIVVRAANTGIDASDSYFIARDQTLAHSLYEIDGQPIADILGTDEIDARANFIAEMDETLAEYLHNCYLKMIRENKNKLAVMDEEDAKEVSEDIKK